MEFFEDAAALPFVDRIFLTEVDAMPEGETFFPLLEKNQWREVARERRDADEKNVFAMAFVVLEKR